MPTSWQRALKALLSCLLVAFFSQWVSLAAPVAGQTTAVAAKELTLTIDAPDEVLGWGETATVTLVVANPGQELVEGVALHLPRGRGLLWEGQAGADNGPWLELGDLAAGESRTIEGQLRVVGVSRIGRLRLHVGLHGRDMQPVREKIVVRTPRPARETADVPAAGGEARLAGGRVRLNFPPGWNERDARLLFQLEELYRQAPDEAGQLLLFEVAASGVDAFDAPVEAELQLGDLTDGAPLPSVPIVMTRANEAEPWTAVESVFDPTTGVLRFTIEHFSSYQVVTDPQVWKLAYNPPGASAYSGAATHGYSVQLPPGIGGLTPDLSLSYSSRPAEGMRVPAMAQGFGAGWGLPEAQINNGNSGGMYKPYDGWPCCNDFHTYNFTLVLNGVTYYLAPATTTDARGHGVYIATSGPELRIEFVRDDDSKPENNTANVTGEFWRVRTADGTTYTFGRTADAEQVVWPVNTLDFRNGRQPRNKAFSAYNWKLSSIEDVHGNRVEYVYETACGQQFADNPNTPGPDYRQGNLDGGAGKQCTEVDAGLKEIRYNFDGATPQTVVTFTSDSMNGNTLRKEELMSVGVFRPTKIEVKHGGKLISRETFTYSNEGAHYFAAWDVATEFWTLAGITHSGSDGKTLPAQSFTYDQEANACDGVACIKLLTRVNNGYGAVTTIGYAGLSGTIWRYVATVDTWDGVAAKYGSTRPQTRTQYTPSTGKDGNDAVQVCYDKAYHVTNNPCHSQMGSGQDSEALIGFDTTAIETQAPAAATGSAWTTLNKTTLTFYNDDYWLLGKTQVTEQFAADNSKLSRSHYNWTRPDGAKPYVFLEWEAHATYRPGDVNTYISHTIAYTYYPVNPGSDQFGGLKTKAELDEAGATYRCTEYAYVSKTEGSIWLINRPARETVKSGGCAGTKIAETLYRYAASQFPSDTSLDARGLLTHVLIWDGANYVREMHTYNARGLVTDVITYNATIAGEAGSYTGTERNRTTTTYTANNLGLPETITTQAADVANQTQTIGYDTTFPWLVASVTDANGIVTRYGYDGFGRLNKVAMPGESLPGDPTISYTYSDGAAPWKVETSTKNTSRSMERTYYDGLGRVVQSQTDNAEVYGSPSADKDLITTVAYDARGLEVCRTVPYAVAATNNAFHSVACSAQPKTTTAYDALGRATSMTTPDGAATRTEYSVATNVTVDSHSRFLLTTVYDGNDHQTARYSDVFGRLTMVREITGDTWATGAPTKYAPYADTRYLYNAQDSLTMVRTSTATDAPPQSGAILRQTTMSYDTLGRKTGMTDPDMGAWTYGYDDAGNLNRQVDAAGQVICFYYDNLNRLTRRVVDATPGDACPLSPPTPDTNHLASYTYGQSAAAHNVGRVTAVSWGSAPSMNKDTFAYDGEGRVAQQTRIINNQTFKLGSLTNPEAPITYDTLDRPLSVRYPDGQALVYTYDQEGVETLTYGGQPILNGLAYTALGQPAKVDRGETMVDTTYGYFEADENFRLKSIQNGPQANLPTFFYSGYDAAGNLTGVSFWDKAYTYTYDALNRLASVGGSFTHAYDYDRLGNIEAVVKDGVTWDYVYQKDQTLSHNPLRLTSVSGLNFTAPFDHNPDPNQVQPSYDKRGNLIKYKQSTTTYSLTYDVEGRLTAVKTEATGQPTREASFSYDADGNRVLAVYKTGAAETSRVYTPFPDYEEEQPVGDTATRRVTFSANGQAVVQRRQKGDTVERFSLHTDHLGNVAAVANSAGVYVTNSYAVYEPFGAFNVQPTATNPSVTDRGFTGHRQNNTGAYDLKLIYMNARYYHPQLGRFISPDTIVPEPENPQSYNRYSYSYNNPVNYTDPTGHMVTAGCDEGIGSCLSDPEDWGANFVNYLKDHTNFGDPTDNPQGQIFLEFYYQTLPLGLEDGASINEIVSQTILDTVSYVSQARAGWYPTSSDADLLVKTILFASVAEAGTDSSINGEQGSVIPRYDRKRYGSWYSSIHEEIYDRDNYTCSYCGKQFSDYELSLDHVESLKYDWESRGGYRAIAYCLKGL